MAGGVSKGVEAYKEGVRGWELFGSILGGAIMGGAMGAVLTIGGVAGLGALTGASLLGISTGAALSLSLAIGVTAGMASYFVEAAFREDIQWNALDFGLAGLSGGFQAATTFAISFIAGRDLGAFDKVLINDLIKGIPQVGRDFVYSMVKVMLGRKNFLTQIGEFFLKSGIVSGLSSLVRSLFDNVLNRNG